MASAEYEFTLTGPDRNLFWRIPRPKDHAPAKERQAYEDLVRRLGRYSLHFRGGAKDRPAVFRTDDHVVAKYVREQIKAGRLKARETLRVPMVCPFCAKDPFRTPSNTLADRKAMDDHVFAVHAEELAAQKEAQEREEAA